MSNQQNANPDLLTLLDIKTAVKKFWMHTLLFSLITSAAVGAIVYTSPDKYNARVQFANSNVSPLMPQSIITKSGIVYQEAQSAPVDNFTITYSITTSEDFTAKMIKKYHLTEKLPQFSDYSFSRPAEMFLKDTMVKHYANELSTDAGVRKTLRYLHLSIDYRTNVYTLSATSPSREINRYLLDIYTKEINNELSQRDSITFKKKIQFYKSDAPKAMTLASKEQFAQIIDYYERRLAEMSNDVESYPLSRISFPSNLDDQVRVSSKRIVLVFGTFLVSVFFGLIVSLIYIRSKKTTL